MTDIESELRSEIEPPRALARERRPRDARSDDLLLGAASAGDAAAFGEFYLRHAKRMLAYFRPRSANTQDAYDLVSETFAEALRCIADFRAERGEAGGWLFGIARNTYRHYARRGAVESRARRKLELSVAPLSPDELDHLERSMDLASLHARVAPAIAALPETLRDAVRLRCVDGCDYDEIASTLGVLPATARKRVSRGLSRLSEDLGDNPFTTHG